MKVNKQKLIAILLVAILIALIPLVAAAPSGTSESTVVEAAKSWIGVKSVHGGDNKSGIDCSHLVFQVYKQAGARGIVFQTVPNMKKNVYYVNTTSPTPGDVIFWKKDITKNNRNYWLVSHVGIYIGNDQFIDTSFDTKTVALESITDVYKDGMPYYARWDPNGSGNNDDSNLPVASFSISPTSGKAPLNVAFTDKSTGATSWSWIFGDGNTSAEKNPTHTYSEAGNYTVVLTVNNENGSNSKTLNIIVQGEQIQEKILPVAYFDSNTTSGSAPLSVQFTDLSEYATGRYWDFGDGANSTEQNPIHTYFAAGNYTVNLTVGNGNGTSSNTATINVLEGSTSTGGSDSGESSSDGSTNGGSSNSDDNDHHSSGNHGSSGGSGGGTGGSPEPQKNVAVKDTTKVFIPGDRPVCFNFTNKVTVVDSINFTSEKTMGKTTAIVEDLKNKSALVPALPEGIVYKSFNVWVGNGGYGDSDNIQNAAISFKVGKSWIKENEIDPSSIVLYKYNDEKKEWVKLSVNPTSEDEKSLHFTANVPGYSSFVITGEKGKQSKLESEPVATVKMGTSKDNGSTIATKAAVENEKAPGFELVFGFVSLLGVFLKSRGR